MSLYRSISLHVYIFIERERSLSLSLSNDRSIYRPIFLSIAVCLYSELAIYMSVRLSIYMHGHIPLPGSVAFREGKTTHAYYKCASYFETSGWGSSVLKDLLLYLKVVFIGLERRQFRSGDKNNP